MGNKHSKADGHNKKKGKDKSKKPKPAQDKDQIQGEEESTPFFTLEVIFEMKSGSTTQPEEHLVDPTITLGDWKEDLKQSRGIQTAVSVRRDDRNDDLRPDHMTLEALQVQNRDVFRFREYKE